MVYGDSYDPYGMNDRKPTDPKHYESDLAVFFVIAVCVIALAATPWCWDFVRGLLGYH